MNDIPYVLPENMRLTFSEMPILIIRCERRVAVSIAGQCNGEDEDDDEDYAEGVISSSS